jgi:hypothetical protein
MVATTFLRLFCERLKGHVMGVLCFLGTACAVAVIAGVFRSEPERSKRPPILAAVASAPALSVVAAGNASDWTELDESQRETLSPLRTAWPALDSVDRRRWLEVAQKVRHLSSESRRRVQARMADWAKLPPKRRAQARLRFVYAERVPVARRTELWRKYQANPDTPATIGRHGPSVTMVAPALAQVRPGATTVPVTQLRRAATAEVEDSLRAPG